MGLLKMMDWNSANSKVDAFLRTFLEASALEVTYELKVADVGERTGLTAEFSGAESQALLARNAELLHALEVVSTDLLRLGPEEHELISFDAEGYKAGRRERLRRSAEVAGRR